MSSTRRGGLARHAWDYYRTPLWAIREFLDSFTNFETIPQHARILDPCAGGDDDFPFMPYPTVLIERGFNPHQITTIDVREDSLAQYKADYLTFPKVTYDLVISNPPFNLALEFIEKGLGDTEDGGLVIMLLRMSILGSVKRFPFWQEHMPKWIFMHHRRMTFTHQQNIDSVEYAHFVWQKGYQVDYSRTILI